MKITNEFTVHAPIDQAWLVLTDLEGIAPCLPGAQLTGVDGDVYTGKVKVKVGPVVSEFTGTAQFVEKDPTAHRAVIDAKGRDTRSAANAAALITAQLTPSGTSTVVTVDTDLKISGKLAQFGSGMIKEVSGKLLGQFVTQLEAKIAAPSATEQMTEAPSAQIPGAPSAQIPGVPSAQIPETPSALTPAASSASTPAAPTLSAASAGVPTAVPSGAAPAVVESGAVPAPSIATAPVASGPRAITSTSEPEALDLMSLAGSSIYKRLIPVAAVVVVVAVVIWRVVR